MPVIKTLVPYGTSEVIYPLPNMGGLGTDGRKEVRRAREETMVRHNDTHQEVYFVLFREDGDPVAYDRQYNIIREAAQEEAAALMARSYIHQIEKDRRERGIDGDVYWIFHPDCDDAKRSRR